MTPSPGVLRAATPDDESFVVEMACHACVIEDRPLPDPGDDEVLVMLPPAGVTPIIAEDHSGTRLGAVWTFYGSPPLRCGAGIGGMLLDALFADIATDHHAMCTNVHIRNPAKRLYEREGFRIDGQGNGPLGLALVKRFH